MLAVTMGAFAWLGQRYVNDMAKRDEECRKERAEWLEAFQEVRESIRQLTRNVSAPVRHGERE